MIARIAGILAGFIVFGVVAFVLNILVIILHPSTRAGVVVSGVLMFGISGIIAVAAYRATVASNLRRDARRKELKEIYARWGKDFQKNR